MVIRTNVSALNAIESKSLNDKNADRSIGKLSSGLRINKSSDDSSGLSISDKLRTQASSISQAISNGNSAVALLQIADKAMSEQSNILDTVKQKLIQAKTDTTSPEGKIAISKDIIKLLDQFNNIAEQTKYNGKHLITSMNDGSAPATWSFSPSEPLRFHMGESALDEIYGPSGVNSTTEGYSGLDGMYGYLNSGGFLSSFAAGDYMEVIDDTLDQLNAWRGEFGAVQNQIESSVRNMMTQKTNLKAAESVIRDVDYSKESANFSQKNIVSQAGGFALSQANSVKQNALRLLQ